MTQTSPQPPKKPLSEQLTDTLIKLLATGSGGSSIFFLFQKDSTHKALIAGAIAVGFGLISSFRESFFKVLQEWTGRKGEQAGRAITEKADRTLDNLSGFQEKYYQRLIYACRDYRTQGLKTKGPFVLDLEKVFVPLRIAPESAGRISPAMIQGRYGSSSWSIWDFLEASRDEQPTYPSMAIIGAPGSGKTTLLEHLTLIYAEKRQPQKTPTLIPILIYLRDVWDAIASSNPNLATLIEQQESIKKLDPPSHWFEDKLRNQQCLVMFDGLDEVGDETQRKRVSKWVSQQIQDYPKARFILTSRPFGFQNAPVERVAVVLEVQPFNLNQMQQFVQNWYLQSEIMRRLGRDDPGVRETAQNQGDDLIKRIKNSPPLAAMALNPLLLTMIATVHCYRGALPGRRVELYGEICDVLLGRRREAKGILVASPLNADQKKAVLQVLALELMQRKSREFTPQEGSNLIENKLVKVAGKRGNPEAFLEQVEKESGLLMERENGVYEFAHKSFQEYLAAVQIKESNQEQILTERITEAWWDETIRLYAAQSDATNLIQAALEHPETNITALKLALDCEEEGLSVEPEVREQLKDKLEAGLESTDREIASLAAQVKLERRLDKLLRIDETVAIDQSFITYAEYQMFVDEWVNSGEPFQPGNAKKAITGISWENALGFCGWLSLKVQGNAEGHEENQDMYYYRLPTAAEAKDHPAEEQLQLDCWTVEKSSTGEQGIRVVKAIFPAEYDKLNGYLSGENWEKAAQETAAIMKKVVNQELPAFDPINLLWWKYFPGRLDLFAFDVVTVNSQGEEIERKRSQARYFTEVLDDDTNLDMIAIPGGTFMMGSPEGEGRDNERPQHQVTVKPFFMGKFQVTQAQWRVIASRTDLKVKRDLNPHPSSFKGDRRPVEMISWYEAVEFCARLSKLTRREYRLPSEAEWEYACRGIQNSKFKIQNEESSIQNPKSKIQNPKYPPFHFGETITGKLANYDASNTYADEPKGEYRHETTPVGKFPPNAFGLYDMHGNVFEWCADTWHENYKGAPNDGSAWIRGVNENYSLLRGGSWAYPPENCRSASRVINFRRVNRVSYDGFRVVCGFGRIL